MVTAGSMGLGTLTTFILYAQRLFEPLRQLAERFTQIQGGLTAIERISELLDQKVEIFDKKSNDLNSAKSESSLISKSAEVTFENVSFSYRPDEVIIKDLSFRVSTGELSLIHI